MKTKIGFIGTGVMGNSMASHLLSAGFPLFIFTRTKSKAEELIEKGARWVESPQEIVNHVDVVMTMLGYPSDVEEIYLGPNGLISSGRAGLTLIDMTTSTPSLAENIYTTAKAKKINALDAPVSGGDIGARDAKLTIMVGGDEAVYDNMQPIFTTMGTNIVFQGKPGNGQHTKMANQIALAGAMVGTCESIAYAERAGLDPQKVLASISAGSASSWVMANYSSRMLSGDFAPGFYVKHFVKDMTIALEEAKKIDMSAPGLTAVKTMYDELVERGEANSGTQVLYKYWDSQSDS